MANSIRSGISMFREIPEFRISWKNPDTLTASNGDYPALKGGNKMPNLTTEELHALSDQLDFEKVLHCKYLSAVQESGDQELKTKFQSCADQHLQNYNTLLNYLR